MKTLITALFFAFPMMSMAHECNLMNELESSPRIQVEVDGGNSKIALVVLTIKRTGSNLVSAQVVNAPDRESEAFFKGDFSYSEKRIRNQNVCVLERTLNGEVINMLAFKKTKSHQGIIYAGAASETMIADLIKTKTYLRFSF